MQTTRRRILGFLAAACAWLGVRSTSLGATRSLLSQDDEHMLAWGSADDLRTFAAEALRCLVEALNGRRYVVLDVPDGHDFSEPRLTARLNISITYPEMRPPTWYIKPAMEALAHAVQSMQPSYLGALPVPKGVDGVRGVDRESGVCLRVLRATQPDFLVDSSVPFVVVRFDLLAGVADD